MKRILIASLLMVLSVQGAWAQDSTPRVGRDAAAKYFQKREPAQFSGSSAEHYLALHFGKYMGSQAYEWGKRGREDNVGGLNGGVTYRVGEWINSMDLNIRIDYQEFEVLGENTSKLSIMPLITFPDSASRFPLYFGFGGGLGVFFKQLEDKSPISFDYQLVLGARFFDIYENTGFFIESGLKNHLHLLTTGQLNGTFLTFGMVFTF